MKHITNLIKRRIFVVLDVQLHCTSPLIVFINFVFYITTTTIIITIIIIIYLF